MPHTIHGVWNLSGGYRCWWAGSLCIERDRAVWLFTKHFPIRSSLSSTIGADERSSPCTPLHKPRLHNFTGNGEQTHWALPLWEKANIQICKPLRGSYYAHFQLHVFLFLDSFRVALHDSHSKCIYLYSSYWSLVETLSSSCLKPVV